MWFDYIKMLERMGKDLHSPSLVAPKDLKHVHDEYVEKVKHSNRTGAVRNLLILPPSSQITRMMYDYHTQDGELFSVVAPTLRECRHKRDEWLAKRNNQP